MLTLRLGLQPDPDTLAALQALHEAYQDACQLIQDVALEHSTRDRSRLHVLLYRRLCPEPGPLAPPRAGQPQPLPAQYATLAIGRVIHQLRTRARSQANPYPPDSFDVDARTASLEPTQGLLRLAHLGSYGVRGQNAKLNRLTLPYLAPNLSILQRQVLHQGRFVAGFLLLEAGPGGRVSLEARFDDAHLPMDPEEHEDLLPLGHA